MRLWTTDWTVSNSLAVFVLFKGKYVFVEVFLKLLVGKVDVELFKSIHFKVFKTENVQHSNEREFVLSSLYSGVDPLQDPAKEVGVHTHGGRVTGVFGLEEGA